MSSDLSDKTCRIRPTTKPTVADWDRDGVPDLLIGAEDGFFYQVKNPRAKQ